MRKVFAIIVIPLLALVGFPPAATSDPAPQHLSVGTSCDDAWQEGTFPGQPEPGPFTDWATAPTGATGNGYIFDAAFRFENVQLAPGQHPAHVYLSARYVNSFSFVTTIDLPVAVQLGDGADFCYVPNIIHRTYTAPLDWHGTPGPGYTATLDLAPLVAQAVDAPGWSLGGSLVVVLVGERTDEYPHSYGWDVVQWDCHCGTPPALDIVP